jgi:uncharacterized protein (TIGR00730 family)
MAGPLNGGGPREYFDFQHDPTWRIFRIMSEFVEGFTFLARIQKSVTIFGSARLPESHPYYQHARELGRALALRGYTIVTGGGPGIMQAANQGAFEVGGNSVGLNIQLPDEQRTNPYVKQGISFNYFFSRKVMLDFSAEAYIFFPGGYGTLDEFFELLTLVQTGKVDRDTPVILIGHDYWSGLTSWIEQELLLKVHAILPGDLHLWTLTDDLDEAVRIVEAGVERQTEERLVRKGRRARTAEDSLEQATQPGTETQQ